MYRGINDFKKCYRSRNNVVKHEKVDLVADFHGILGSWWNHFSRLLNVHVHGVNDVMQRKIHTAKQLVPDPSAFEIEMAI